MLHKKLKKINIFYYFLSAFTVTASLLLFAIQPLRLNRSVWRGYRILAVPAEIDMETYISVLTPQELRETASELCIDARLASLGKKYYNGYPFTQQENYAQWFKDIDGKFRYFYIPYTSLLRFITLYFSLIGKNIPFYLEAGFPYAIFKGMAALLLFLCCAAGAQRKLLFAGTSFSFVCYAFCVKSSLSLTTALLSIFSVTYWLEALGSDIAIPWKQLKERIRHNVFMLLLPVFPLSFAIIDGFLPFLFFCLALLLSANAVFSIESFLYLQAEYKNKYRAHPSFRVFVMHPQSWSQFWNTRYAVVSTIVTIILLFFSAVFSLFFSWNRLERTIESIPIPMPTSPHTEPFTENGFFALRMPRISNSLPDLTDYIQDHWYAAVLPYLNVHEPLKPLTKKNRITFDFFYETSTGMLHREEKTIEVFDTAFIHKVLQNELIALLPLEKMLIRQEGFFSASYQYKRLYTVGKFTAFFIALSALLFPSILIIMAKTR